MNQISTAPISTKASTPVIYYKYSDIHPSGGISLTVLTNFELLRNPNVRSIYDPHNLLTDNQVIQEFKICTFAEEITQQENDYIMNLIFNVTL